MGAAETVRTSGLGLWLWIAAVLVALSAGQAAAGDKPRPTCAAGVNGRFDTEEGWERLLSCVRTGDSVWLDAALRVQQAGLDGGAPGEPAMAVGDALERNAAGVLRLLRRGYSSVNAVCGCEGHEDLLGFDFDQAMATIQRRAVGVRGVQAEDLTAERRSCLKELRKLEQQAKQHVHEWFVR